MKERRCDMALEMKIKVFESKSKKLLYLETLMLDLNNFSTLYRRIKSLEKKFYGHEFVCTVDKDTDYIGKCHP